MVEFSRFRAYDQPDDDQPDDDRPPRARLAALHREAEHGNGKQAEPDREQDPRGTSDLRRRLAERWLPQAWPRTRWDPGKSGVMALGLGGLVVLAVVFVVVWTSRPSVEPVPAGPIRTAMPAPTSTPPPGVVVSLVGRVVHPGLVTVAPGDRVADALRAAGGPLPNTDITTVNLARKLADGEQLYVGIPAPAQAGMSRGGVSQKGAGSAAAGGKLDLNAATEEQLDQLPGVGEVTARRVVQWRTEHGRFSTVDQLQEVKGIGDTRLSRLRELVRV